MELIPIVQVTSAALNAADLDNGELRLKVATVDALSTERTISELRLEAPNASIRIKVKLTDVAVFGGYDDRRLNEPVDTVIPSVQTVLPAP